MTQWLAGMRITPARLAAETVVDQSVGVVAATGFTVTTFAGRKSKGVCTVRLLCSRSGASIAETGADTGNIADTDMATLPVGWRPPERINCMWGNGTNDGEASIATDGLITLRSTSGSSGLANGTNPRIYATWICEDPN